MGDALSLETALAPQGHLMIRNVLIENYKCFDEISLSKCKRVNLVVGKNATGKTALLEALFIATGLNPAEITLRMRGWRGLEGNITGSLEQIEEAVWSECFHLYDLNRTIRLKIQGTHGFTRQVEVNFLKRERPVRLSEGGEAAPPEESAIEFLVSSDGKNPLVLRPIFSAGQYRFPPIERRGVHASFFSTVTQYTNLENVRRFSELDTARRVQPAIAALKREFPFIEGVSVLAHAGIPMLHADIASLPKKIPISSVSTGVHKFLVILLAIAEHRNSAILIDEFENGLHYSRLPSMWGALLQFAEENRTQLFVSTHSLECIQALAEHTKASKDVSLIRMESNKGKTTVRQFVGLDAAIYGEVR